MSIDMNWVKRRVEELCGGWRCSMEDVTWLECGEGEVTSGEYPQGTTLGPFFWESGVDCDTFFTYVKLHKIDCVTYEDKNGKQSVDIWLNVVEPHKDFLLGSRQKYHHMADSRPIFYVPTHKPLTAIPFHQFVWRCLPVDLIDVISESDLLLWLSLAKWDIRNIGWYRGTDTSKCVF